MKSKKRGFTVIEVVLVLMIAGLIFMMAFVTLPNLWASERDAERKAKVMEFVSDIKTYQTNNSRGALPTLNGNGPDVFTWSEARGYGAKDDSWRAFVRDYVSSDFEDPTGQKVSFYVVNCLSGSGSNLSVAQTCAYQNNLAQVNVNAVPTIGVNNVMYVVIGSTCDGDRAVKSSNSRDVSAVYVLERAGRYCYNV